MPSEIHIEKMIAEAMARGEFSNLKGEGKSIDLDAYFNTPEDMRMAFSMLKSNEFVPEEVDMLREISGLKERLRVELPADGRAGLEKRLHDRTLAFTIAIEMYRRKR